MIKNQINQVDFCFNSAWQLTSLCPESTSSRARSFTPSLMSSNRSLTSSGGLCWRSENTSWTIGTATSVGIFIQMCYIYDREHCAVENIPPGREQWRGENQMTLVGNRLVNGDRRASLQLKRWCLFLAGGSLPSLEAMALIWPSCLFLQALNKLRARGSASLSTQTRVNDKDMIAIRVRCLNMGVLHLAPFVGHFTAHHIP